ncbi:MAG: hypothetical protein ACO277_08175 [Ilumatobacteraceae bacterium]
MVRRLQRLLARVRVVLVGLFRRKPAKVVLGVAEAGAPAPALTGQVLRFRGYDWHQRGGRDEKGRLTFVREAAVGGKAVLVEAQVLETDLERVSDGTLTLRGRE